jgi:hypothetical protein
MRLIVIFFLLFPFTVFSQFETKKLNDNNGTIEVTFNGKVGQYPNFEDLNSSLSEFSNQLNRVLLQSNYKILQKSEQALISGNELTIKLKLVNSWDSKNFSFARIDAVFVSDSLVAYSDLRKISRENYLHSAWMESVIVHKKSIKKFHEDGSIVIIIGPRFESNKTGNLNPKNPKIEYNLAFFTQYISIIDKSIETQFLSGITELSKENPLRSSSRYEVKGILPIVNIEKYKTEEKFRTQNNQIKAATNTEAANQSQSNKNGTIYDAILKGFTSEQLNYLNYIRSINSDPKGIRGKVCGYDYDICRICKEKYKYNKLYYSKIYDIQFIFTDMGKEYLDGIFKLNVLISPEGFAKNIRNFSEELKITLREIKAKNIYYCEGKPKGYCEKHN